MDLLQRFASAWCGTAEAGDTHLVSAVTGWIVIPRWFRSYLSSPVSQVEGPWTHCTPCVVGP